MSGSADRKAVDVCHIEIPARDLQRARSFYGGVFGWTFQENHPASDYWFFQGGNVRGAFTSGRNPSDDGICLILQVDDIPVTLEAIQQHGGKVLAGKRALPDDMGYVASFRDPDGVRMEIYSDT